MVAGAAGDPALEQLGDAGVEAFRPGAELRGLMVGRSLGSVAHKFRAPKG
jgi:hypothetical protein